MKLGKNFLSIFLGMIGIAILVLAIPQGAKLAEGSSKSINNTAYPPPNTPIPVNVTPTIKPTILPTQIPSPTPVKLDNGWYLYEDKDAGFSISYPPNSHISTSINLNDKYKTVNIAFIQVGTSGGYQGMVIGVLNDQSGLSIEKVVEKIYGDSPIKPSTDAIKSSLAYIKVGNTTGIKTFIPPTITEVSILIPHRNDVLFFAPVHGLAADSVDPEVLKLFYKILDTLLVTP
jgi:hypothetical protein